jgi:three-Cys-motif partner protein
VIDLTAGPGVIDSNDGSPMILASLVKGLTGATADLMFCEKNRNAIDELRPAARSIDSRRLRTHVLHGDHNQTVPRFLETGALGSRPHFGLVYFDPNGCLDVPIYLYQTLQTDPRTRRLDLLLNLSATGYKRAGRNGVLGETLELLPKKFKFISQERIGRGGDAFGWTFVIATDWEGARPARGFVPLDSREGRRALWYATHYYTKEQLPVELEEPQLRLVA